MASDLQQVLHFYNRAGFGLPNHFFSKANTLKLKKERKKFLKEGRADKPLQVFEENPILKYQSSFTKGQNKRKALRQELSKIIKEGRKQFRPMNVSWMQQMVDPKLMLREKLTFFWHDHFGVRVNNAYHAQLHNNLLRKHALGKYGDLLKAVAKDPAMMDFLNTQQNVKRKPNENFARELFELYTLGRGHYTEADIKNAARAFTGWKYNRFTDQFVFLERVHDKGEKTVFGLSGNYGGEDIIDMALRNKQTAKYLSAKLFQYYVSDEPEQQYIDLMADRLFSTDYDMGDLLDYMFNADWFYQDHFMNSKVKSPIELINSLRIHLGLKYERPEALVFLQNGFDQRLFFPPGVNGWPVGREWINNASLVQRMRLSQVLVSRADVGTRFKESLDSTNPARGLSSRLLQTGDADWKVFEETVAAKGLSEALKHFISYFTNQRKITPEIEKLLLQNAEKSKQPLKSLIVSITGLPEYQLA